MITDAMLREAAGEAERFLLAHLPEPQPHQFSPRFERRMQKLISRAKHPVRHQVLRYVAAVLLAILTLFGAVFAASPQVRAAVSGWVRSIYKNAFHYTNDVPAPSVPSIEYRPTVIPDGYTLLNVTDLEDGKYYLYADDNGMFFKFRYMYSTGNANLFLYVEDYQQHSGFVHGVSADIYLSDKEDESSVIVWQDADSGVLFILHAIADKSQLIALAEGVQRIN